MGWRYRKSVTMGPFRVNLSKSGVGWSVGGPGFRTGRSARGRSYNRFTLPGTGLSYETSRRSGGGCLGSLLLVGAAGWGLLR